MNSPHKKLLLAPVLMFWIFLMCDPAAAQMVVFPDLDGSDPTTSQSNVMTIKGRKSLQYHFKLFNATTLVETPAFTLDMSAATVTLTIGAAAPLTCACANPASTTCSGTPNPAPGACAFTVVDGDLSVEPDMDTVQIFFNGNFPTSVAVQYSVTGARSSAPAVANQSSDPNVITFNTSAVAATRVPASIELVFDISGSMDWPATPGGTVKRMDALKQASQSFFAMLNDLAMLGDQVGVVYFSNDATVFDPVPGGNNLAAAHDPTQTAAVAANIQGQVPTNGTSIGDGLQTANGATGFGADPAATKRVFLLSDGEQNTPNFAKVVSPNLTIVDSLAPGGTTLMTYQAEINVCPVTAGRMAAPGNVLQQAIAAAKCNNNNAVVGDMAQTFTAGELNTYFTQTLASVLVGDKIEHVRNVTGTVNAGTDVQEKFRANTNDIALSIVLSWDSNRHVRRLPFRLKAPDGTVVDTTRRTQLGNGMSYTAVRFPLRQGNAVINHKGEWTVELLGSQIDPVGGNNSLGYQLIVMLDNANLASEYSLTRSDVGTGEPIPVQLKLTENGAPVTGATVVSQLLVPANGLGNVLSTASRPAGSANTSGDPIRSQAQEKLLLLLADPASASLFVSQSLPAIVLLDNGSSANGDAVANDGIYTGLFPGGQREGHYHFVINARGSTATNGDFQRTQELAVFVRPKPTATETDLKVMSSTRQPDGSVIVRLSATPRDRFRNLIGPDYLDHLKIKSTAGTAVTPLADKLDGSYEISYQLPSASSNPDITVEVLGSDVVTKPLDALNGDQGTFKRWGLSLHAGATTPHGFFDNIFNPGPSFGADLEYRITSLFSVEAYLGHDRFKSQFFNDTFSFTHLSGHAKFTFGSGTVRPSVHAGLGAYFPEAGGTKFGGNVGASLQFWITPNFAVEPSYNYRIVDFSGPNVNYSTWKGGIRIRF